MRRATLLSYLWLASPAGCGESPIQDGAVGSSADYPAGPYGIERDHTLPDLSFPGISEAGELSTIYLHDYAKPDATGPELLIVQVSGGLWCGTCLWMAQNIDEIVSPFATHVDRLDLILRTRDNAPITSTEDALLWRDRVAPDRAAVAIDPDFSFLPLLNGIPAPLPMLVLIDERTMRVLDVLSNPSPDQLEEAVAKGLDQPKPRASRPLMDGIFYQNEWDMISEMGSPQEAPHDPSNRYGDSPAARALGERLFFDPLLSPSGDVSCASCHDPDKGLSDDRPVALGHGLGSRRSPSITLSSYSRWLFWDGRADSLWAQALGPFESPDEFNASRLFVVQQVGLYYGREYEEAFPEMPLPGLTHLPAKGKPGDAEYDSLSQADQRSITQAFVNIGKAIAAYESTFKVEPTAFDTYIRGDFDALTPEQKYGLVLFARSGCMQCHWGSRLTDDAFHNIGTASVSRDGTPDEGRLSGLSRWQESEFRRDSVWSDADDGRAPGELAPTLRGQFRTPSLRGVSELAFFNHNGALGSLSEVMEAYGRGNSTLGDGESLGDREPWLMTFGETAQWGLVPFLRILSGFQEPLLEEQAK